MSEVLEKKVAQFGTVRRKHIFNRINALHYHNSPLLIVLQHKQHDFRLFVKARPEPISGERALAHWIAEDNLPDNFNSFKLHKIILSTDHSSYEFLPEAYRLETWGITFTIPEHATEIELRKQIRYHCAGANIKVTVSQNAIVFSGRMLDYSVNGILVQLDKKEGFSFSWLNENRAVILNILNNEDPVYTGEVKLSPRARGQYLLFFDQDAVPRHVPRKYRSRRQQLTPSPDLVFDHPIINKKIRLKIFDLSSLGFSVEENASSASLLPGLLIRSATISLAGNINIKCMIQVIYVKTKDDDPSIVRVGLTILNIDSHDHLKLISLVQQAKDSRAYISNQIDPSDLFDFFFETGFIYPNKYAELARKKDEIINAYMTLYKTGANISRHFVYQDTGKILGHFSALQVYRKTWFCQHHAALHDQKAGLRVVRAISEYVNDSYQLDPTNIEYIIGYYRNSNRFPKRYFGDYVDQLKDFNKTSLDWFSYISEARRFADAPQTLAPGWGLEPAQKLDLVNFEGFYKKFSGGLLTKALDMSPENFDDTTLSATYKKNGLTRERKLFALRQQGRTIALIDVQSSNAGLNLSEITNAISVYMIESAPEHMAMVGYSIRHFALNSGKMADPVMVYPNTYLKNCEFNSDKEYIMWTLNVPLGMESYMAWMNRFCR